MRAHRLRFQINALAAVNDFKSLDGRGSRIRTCDLKYPKLPRYRAALYPVFALVANMRMTREQAASWRLAPTDAEPTSPSRPASSALRYAPMAETCFIGARRLCF